MLSTTDNDFLTHVGPGTPMGTLLRRYWIPGVLSSEVTADAPAHRTRLLGEDLLVLRMTSGDLAAFNPACPHRGASLYFGRNEENGLRCAYHGWKFDAAGACIDMPSEPPESNFKDKVKLKHYAVKERNGLVWIYMGPFQDTPPELPLLEWNLVPEDQCYLSKRVAQNNFMQSMEGEIDSSHSGFLHSRFDEPYAGSERSANVRQQQGMVYKMLDKHPRFQALDTDYGVLIGARRNAEEDSYYWRITQFLAPFHTIIPPYGDNPSFSGHAWVPMDDHHTLALCFTYHPTEALSEPMLRTLKHGQRAGQEGLHPTVDAFLPPANRPEAAWWPKHNIDNDFGIDWEVQRIEQFSGLPGTWPQDSGMQETMGHIYDRTQEHLGVSDSAIIRTRRSLIQAARNLENLGIEPASASDPDMYSIRSAAIVLPRSADWIEGSTYFREVEKGVNHAAV
jgi:phthalate 4,5-dioxygenase oxygenase subunit